MHAGLAVFRRNLSKTTLQIFAAVWTAAFVLYLSDLVPNLRSVPVWSRAYGAFVTANVNLLTWIIGYALAAQFSFAGSVRWRHLITGILIVIATLPIARLIHWTLMRPVGFYTRFHGVSEFIFAYTPISLVLLATTIAASHAVYYLEELGEREVAAARLQNQLATARAAALQSQLQPHFLFNSLNSISALIALSPQRAEEALQRLEELLGILLTGMQESEIELHRELDLLRLYVDLELLRFGERLRVVIHSDPSIENTVVPALLLQPVVENAIRHGAGALRGDRFVCVLAQQMNGSVQFIVRDNGPGLLRDYKEGIGLRNTRQRLATLYPEHHRFQIRNVNRAGCEVFMELPR